MRNKEKEIVCLNGKFLLQEEAKVSAISPGFLYGWGLFETMRAYNGKIVYLDAHLKRIKEGSLAIAIKFNYSLSKLTHLIEETIRINGFKDTYIRVTLWKDVLDTGLLILVKKYQPYPVQKYKKGFSVTISSLSQNEYSFLAKIKTTNRLLYELSLNEASAKGLDEALILNSRGYVCEAARSNIFLVKDSKLFSPSLDCGCLDGVTRNVVFALAKVHRIKAYEGKFTIQDLLGSDEAFLTNSLMGVMPLAFAQGKQIGKGVKYFKLAKFFIEKYRHLLKDGT